jgi:chorismate synthase
LPLVIAGVIAKKIVNEVKIAATLVEAGGMSDIQKAVDEALLKNDSIGGIIECRADNIPVGWGEPFFNSVESQISHLAFAVPAVKGIEFGSGFSSSKLLGSHMNDVIINQKGKTKTNNSGGISGGITNGNQLLFRMAIKPASSISVPQETYHLKEKKIKELKIGGRHDTCIALRVPVVAEAITAIALADLKLLYKANL